MIKEISKFGIIVSLLMVAHALFYPNKYSLIIAVFGYIIALVSAVVYGLCKAPLRPSIEKVEDISKNPQSFNLKNMVDAYSKLSIATSPRIRMGHRVPSGFTMDMLDLDRAKLEYLERDKLAEWGVTERRGERRGYQLSPRKIDDISIFKPYGEANKIKHENVNVPECQ